MGISLAFPGQLSGAMLCDSYSASYGKIMKGLRRNFNSKELEGWGEKGIKEDGGVNMVTVHDALERNSLKPDTSM